MTADNILTLPKSLPRLALPLVISFTLRFAFTFVDWAYAAALKDDDAAVAAIAFYLPFQSFYIALWVGISAGFTACLSHAFGSRDEARIDQLKRAMLRIEMILIPSLVALGIGLYFITPLLPLEPDLATSFRTYGTVMFIGMPLTGFWSIRPDSVVKAHHDTRSTMFAGLWAAISNVTMNTLFVFCFDMGLFGIALATVLSRIPAFLYASSRARKLEAERKGENWTTPQTQAWPRPVPTILKLALPGGLTYLLMTVEGGVINRVLLTLPESTTAIKSFGLFDLILRLALMPAIAASVAVIPFVGRNLPSGHGELVLRDLRRTLLGTAAFALLITVPVGYLFSAPIIEYFIAGEDMTAELTALATQAFHLLPLGSLAVVPFLFLRPVLEGLQRPGLGVAVTLLRYIVLSLPLVIAGRYLAEPLGYDPLLGLLLGLISANLVASIVTAIAARRSLNTELASLAQRNLRTKT